MEKDLARLAPKPVSWARSTAFTRVDIVNDGRGSTSSDYFLLQKVADGWRIVAKVLSVPL